MENNRVLLGMRMKEIRKARQLSQEQVSDKVGISPKHLSRVEMGKGYPSLDTLEKIAAVLKVELKEFFEFDAYNDAPVTTESISQMFEALDPSKKQLIYRIFKSIEIS